MVVSRMANKNAQEFIYVQQNVKNGNEINLIFVMIKSFLCYSYNFITFSIASVKNGRLLVLSFLRSNTKLFLNNFFPFSVIFSF